MILIKKDKDIIKQIKNQRLLFEIFNLFGYKYEILKDYPIKDVFYSEITENYHINL